MFCYDKRHLKPPGNQNVALSQRKMEDLVPPYYKLEVNGIFFSTLDDKIRLELEDGYTTPFVRQGSISMEILNLF